MAVATLRACVELLAKEITTLRSSLLDMEGCVSDECPAPTLPAALAMRDETSLPRSSSSDDEVDSANKSQHPRTGKTWRRHRCKHWNIQKDAPQPMYRAAGPVQ